MRQLVAAFGVHLANVGEVEEVMGFEDVVFNRGSCDHLVKGRIALLRKISDEDKALVDVRLNRAISWCTAQFWLKWCCRTNEWSYASRESPRILRIRLGI